MMMFYNSLMSVILCTQIFPVSCQLPLGQIPQAIRADLSAISVLCQGSGAHDESSGRWEPHAWPGVCTHSKQTQSRLSLSKERINFNVTLANAKYQNQIKYNIGNLKRLPIKWKTI